MDYDYEQEDYAPRLLWGRLVLLLIALVLVFFVGRCTAGGGGGSELADMRTRVMELSSENQSLRNQLEAAQATQQPEQPGQQGGQPTDAPAQPTEQPTTGSQDPVPPGETTYIVESGDTLTGIAEQFYGEQSKWELIADANNIDSDTPLRVGQELVIPEEQ